MIVTLQVYFKLTNLNSKFKSPVTSTSTSFLLSSVQALYVYTIGKLSKIWIQIITWWEWVWCSEIRIIFSCPHIIHSSHQYLQCFSQATHSVQILSSVCCVRPQHSITVSSDVNGVVVNGHSLQSVGSSPGDV